MGYEFTFEEERAIAGVGIRGLLITLVILIGSVIDIIILAGDGATETQVENIVFVILIVAQVVVGVAFVFPARSFRNVARTEGTDVEYLMNGLRRMLVSTRVIIGALVLAFLMAFVLLFV